MIIQMKNKRRVGGLPLGAPPSPMSIFSINCRGSGNASTIREIPDFIRNFAPSVFCILETQISRTMVEALDATLGYDIAFAVHIN
jgi:hypothetical protein